MQKEMYDQMNETELYHWWFKSKREIVLSLAKPYLEGDIKIADFGCGCGLFLKELETYGNAIGYDYSEHALDYCRGKFKGKLVQLDLNEERTDLQNNLDVVFALDIIEHVKNDRAAIENIYRTLKPGGYAIFTVPAFQRLWSQNDINNMHYRRYNRKELAELLEKAGFVIEYQSYYNFYLFFPAVIVRFLTKILKIDKNSTIEYNSGNSVFNTLLYKIFSCEKRRISKHKRFPYGLSIIVLAKRGEEKE